MVPDSGPEKYDLLGAKYHQHPKVLNYMTPIGCHTLAPFKVPFPGTIKAVDER